MRYWRGIVTLEALFYCFEILVKKGTEIKIFPFFADTEQQKVI